MLSIVVPVYGVAGYLRQCLDSIVDQSFTDFEVVAVNDCSPDNCREILDGYANRDPRVRALHLQRNVGLGQARNIGLADARGEYVWFVDSDDWLADGTLQAVARRLRETAPDVLLIDHDKVGVTGESQRNDTLGTLLPEAKYSHVFSALDCPEVLAPFHTAWSRIMRRTWLTGLGVQFQSGWAEDISFVYPVTAMAQRISVLHRVCYHYRQRRDSITKSNDVRHFDMFDQYEITWQTFDRWGITDPALRAWLFWKMQRHYRWVLVTTDRVPRHQRREYFTRMAADFNRYLPATGYAAPRLERLKVRLISSNTWVMFSAWRFSKRAASRATAAADKIRRAGRVVGRSIRDQAMYRYYAVQRHLPIDADLAVYTVEEGDGYRGNPAAIYEKARELAPSVLGVWIVKQSSLDDLPPAVPFAVIGSARSYRLLARAKYLFNNVEFPDWYVKRAGSTVVQTHHGTPVKSKGVDRCRLAARGREADIDRLLRDSDKWDISLSMSPFNTEVWQRSYPSLYQTLEIGCPRNDRLDRATPADVAAARAALGLSPDESAVLLAPARCEYQPGFQPLVDLDEFADSLGPRTRILVRAHRSYRRTTSLGRSGGHPRVLDVSEHPRVEELYLAADVLVTDYSSAMFDYAHLDRPIVIYAPDWETFQLIRGVTFDLRATPPGIFVQNFQELIDGFTTGDFNGEAASKARGCFRTRFCPHTDGGASERVIRRVILSES